MLDTQRNKEIETLELLNRLLEKDRFEEIKSELKLKNIHVRGFYHTSAYRSYYEDVIKEQLWILDGKRRRIESYTQADDLVPVWENTAG